MKCITVLWKTFFLGLGQNHTDERMRLGVVNADVSIITDFLALPKN